MQTNLLEYFTAKAAKVRKENQPAEYQPTDFIDYALDHGQISTLNLFNPLCVPLRPLRFNHNFVLHKYDAKE